jgi:hypothetical protein
MNDCTANVDTIEALRSYIAKTLASFESLDASQWQLRQQVLYRSGKPCGMHFSLQGPRMASIDRVQSAGRANAVSASARVLPPSRRRKLGICSSREYDGSYLRIHSPT